MSSELKTLISSLNLGLCIEGTDKGLKVNQLSAAEQKQLAEIQSERKKGYWLKGRNALKSVLHKLAENTDTSGITFPNSRFSITHSGEYALSIGCKQNTRIQGIGVDIELNRFPKDGSEKYFLTKAETDWLRSLDVEDQSLHRLRLWTIKEAVYKAYPNNNQIRLTHLETKNPERESGKILIRDPKLNLGENITCDYFCYLLPLSDLEQEVFDLINFAQPPIGTGYLTIALFC